MSFTPAELTKNWENPDDFPTYEESEDQVRADMQILFTELKNCINRLIVELEAANTQGAGSGASSIGIDQVVGLENYDNVQDALAGLMQAINDVSVGVLADHSVSSAKLSRTSDPAGAAVDEENIEDGAVTGPKIADGAVTTEKVNLIGGSLEFGKTGFANRMYGGLVLVNAGGPAYGSPEIYGQILPASAPAGRIFFKKIQ